MKADNILKIVLPLLVTALILIFWEICGEIGIINTALFSSPSRIASYLINSNVLLAHITHSLMRLGISVLIGYTLGLVVGIIITDYANLGFLEDFVSFFMSIPGIAWAPLFILILGFGDVTIITVGIITAFFPVVYNIIHGLREVNTNLIHLGDILQYNYFQKLTIIKLPAIMNYLLIALKLSFARTWRTVIAVEMIAASMFGLGYMIFDARELINSKAMFTGIIMSGLIYFVIENVFIRIIEKFTVLKWGMKVKI